MPPERLQPLEVASARQPCVRRPSPGKRSLKIEGAFPQPSRTIPQSKSFRRVIELMEAPTIVSTRSEHSAGTAAMCPLDPDRQHALIRPDPPSHLAVLHFTPHCTKVLVLGSVWSGGSSRVTPRAPQAPATSQGASATSMRSRCIFDLHSSPAKVTLHCNGL
mgnify:CR=1 FL=1